MASYLKEKWQVTALLYSRHSKDSDIVFVVEGQKLYFYKQLLGLVSPVFKAMLYSEFKEKETRTINMKGKRITEIVMLLAWIDPAVTCKIEVNEAERLLLLADEYEISALRKSCQAILIRQMSTAPVSQLLHYFELAYQRNMVEFKNAAMDRIQGMNFSQLTLNKAYLALEQSTVTQILEGLAKEKDRRTQQSGFGLGRAKRASVQNTNPGFGAAVSVQNTKSNKKEVIPSASETTKYSVLSDLTDVTIGIKENRLYYYYSDVLRLASPVFATKLENLDENGKISLDEENVQDISMVLELLDPSNEEDVITNVETALHLLWVSLDYDIQVLCRSCEAYLICNISECDEHELMECVLLADRLQCDKLMETAKQQVHKFGISKLIDTESYQQIDDLTRINFLEYIASN